MSGWLNWEKGSLSMIFTISSEKEFRSLPWSQWALEGWRKSLTLALEELWDKKEVHQKGEDGGIALPLPKCHHRNWLIRWDEEKTDFQTQDGWVVCDGAYSILFLKYLAEIHRDKTESF